jgi:hypothetical protein
MLNSSAGPGCADEYGSVSIKKFAIFGWLQLRNTAINCFFFFNEKYLLSSDLTVEEG